MSWVTQTAREEPGTRFLRRFLPPFQGSTVLAGYLGFRRSGSTLGYIPVAVLRLQLIGFLLFPCLLVGQSARALVEQGNLAYAAEEYEQALEAYEQASELEPDSAHIWFNRGSTLYKQGDYKAAGDAFEQAALRGSDPAIEALSKFSHGNAAFREGVGRQQTDPRQALQSVEEGVQLYQDALQLDPGLNDARHNIEVARLRMRELLEQLKNQPQSPSQGGEGEKQPPGEEDLSEKLQDLVRKQQQAAEQSQEASEQQKQEGQSQEMQQQARDLADQQKDLEEQTRQLSREMEKKEQQGQTSKTQQAQQKQARQDLEEAAGRQRQAGKDLEKGDFDQAQSSQEQARKKLEDALQAMGGKPQDSEEGDDKRQPQPQPSETARTEPSPAEPGSEAAQQQQTARDILDKEKSDRQQRQSGLTIKIVPVDKDW